MSLSFPPFRCSNNLNNSHRVSSSPKGRFYSRFKCLDKAKLKNGAKSKFKSTRATVAIMWTLVIAATVATLSQVMISLVSFSIESIKQSSSHLVDNKLATKVNNNVLDETMLTVIITTYKQPTCLSKMICLLSQCTDLVAEIRVNWFEQSSPLPWSHLFPCVSSNRTIPIVYDEYPNRLSYRFHPRNFTTQAIFSVDVDTFYTCNALSTAFQTWKELQRQEQNKGSITTVDEIVVGFHPRYLHPSNKLYNWEESYHAPFKFNTVFITKGGIVSARMYEEYFKEKFKFLRSSIDEAITAEDLFMSFLLAARKKKVITVLICLEAKEQCAVDCNENNVGSLASRSGSSPREAILKILWDYFGQDTFVDASNDGSSIVKQMIVWQNPLDANDGVCKSKSYWEGTVPPCWMCSNSSSSTGKINVCPHD